MELENSIPTKEEFMEYAKAEGWTDWAEELWAELEKHHWLTNDGAIPQHWHVIANARNSVVMQRLGIPKVKKEKIQRDESILVDEEFPESNLHYVCYIAGVCNNSSPEKTGGAAYIITKGGNAIHSSSHGQKSTTNNRMSLLAISSATKSCEDGAWVDIYTDNNYCSILSRTNTPETNADLFEQCKQNFIHLSGVRIHILTPSKDKDRDAYKQLTIAKQMANKAKELK